MGKVLRPFLPIALAAFLFAPPPALAGDPSADSDPFKPIRDLERGGAIGPVTINPGMEGQLVEGLKEFNMVMGGGPIGGSSFPPEEPPPVEETLTKAQKLGIKFIFESKSDCVAKISGVAVAKVLI